MKHGLHSMQFINSGMVSRHNFIGRLLKKASDIQAIFCLSFVKKMFTQRHHQQNLIHFCQYFQAKQLLRESFQ